ncbi:MAG: hypothetical protein NTY01_08930 [Verrucomicrobia bacterium]|nr:hypothetical protein [Verrucomicrobiota bacterium]
MIDQLAAVGNRQLVRRTRRSDKNILAARPNRTGVGYQHAVADGTAAPSDEAGGTGHMAAVGDGQLVERAAAADIEDSAVAPERASAGYEDSVVAGGG